MLIAITGIRPRIGVTTAAVALTAAWPRPGQAVLVEADPRGGRLAHYVGDGPGCGLMGVAAAAGAGRCGVAQLVEHARLLPVGVPVITAPTRADHAHAFLTGATTEPDQPLESTDGDLVVIVDCGIAHPDSAARPIMTGAEVLLVLVDIDVTDRGLVAKQLREIASWTTGARAVLLVGSDPADESAAGIGVPIMGRLPRDPRGASELLFSAKVRSHRGSLLSAAREIAAGLQVQLSVERPLTAAVVGEQCGRGRSRSRWREPHAGSGLAPVVYRVPGHLADRGLPSRHHSSRARTHLVSSCGPETGDAELEILTSSPSADSSTVPAPARSEAPPAARRCDTPVVPLSVNVLGPLRITWNSGPDGGDGIDITNKLQPRGRELVALLAVYPGGVSRERLVEALWGARCPVRPTNAINTALARLRAALAVATHGAVSTSIIADDRIRYQLDPARVVVDYWTFASAVDARRGAGTEHARLQACRRIVECAGGLLAQDLCAPWIEPIRESVRRDHLNALGVLARSLVDDDPRRTLDLLEKAIAADPGNELIYRDIVRLQARLGEYDAIERTMRLLALRLAEVGLVPTAQTRELAQRLRWQAP